MALIQCPECGKEVSDKAKVCPNCGFQISAEPPAVPVPPAPPAPPAAPVGTTTAAATKTSAPNVGIDTQKLKCPYCKEALGPKDILSSGWAKCPSCGENIRLTGANGEYDDNVLIERLLPFHFTNEEYHQIFMQQIMDDAGENVFEHMRTVSFKRIYFWVREFGRGNERALYPMCQYGKDVFTKLRGRPWLLMEEYEAIYPTDRMVPFNSEDIRDTDTHAKELTAAECKHEFSHTEIGQYDATPNYYCLPLIEEVIELDGQQYTFICTAGNASYSVNWENYPCAELPTPNYTEMKPVTITLAVIVGLAILIPVVYGIFTNFWATVIVLVVVGIIVAVLFSILSALFMAIAAIPMGIDTLICKAVNARRRTTFRARYTALQESKKQSCKARMNADVTYEVPEFPIP